MDREVQEKLEKYGAGFVNFLQQKYFLPAADNTATNSSSSKGKSPAEGTSCASVKPNSEKLICTTLYASPLDHEREKAERARFEEFTNNLLNEEQSSSNQAGAR